MSKMDYQLFFSYFFYQLVTLCLQVQNTTVFTNVCALWHWHSYFMPQYLLLVFQCYICRRKIEHAVFDFLLAPDRPYLYFRMVISVMVSAESACFFWLNAKRNDKYTLRLLDSMLFPIFSYEEIKIPHPPSATALTVIVQLHPEQVKNFIIE